jgi:hypothetical protein
MHFSSPRGDAKCVVLRVANAREAPNQGNLRQNGSVNQVLNKSFRATFGRIYPSTQVKGRE